MCLACVAIDDSSGEMVFGLLFSASFLKAEQKIMMIHFDRNAFDMDPQWCIAGVTVVLHFCGDVDGADDHGERPCFAK